MKRTHTIKNASIGFEKSLYCLHLNIRCLLSSIEELKIIAQQSRAAVIAVTEIWHDCSVLDNEITITPANTVCNPNVIGSCWFWSVSHG